jgi:cytochrome P450
MIFLRVLTLIWVNSEYISGKKIMLTLDLNLDYSNPQFLDNPYPIFAQLRAESPVVWDAKFQTGYSNGVGAWHILSYADIQTLLRDRHISSNPPPLDLERYPQEVREFISQLFGITQKAIGFSDPPKHTRLRSLVGKAFNPHAVEHMRPRIQEIVDGLLANLQDRTKIEFIQDFAEQLPINVVADLIGFPREDHYRIKNWSTYDVGLFGGAEISLESASQSRTEFLNYIQEQIDQRRQHPGKDLLSALIAVQEEGDRLSNAELEGMIWSLILAGYETTVNILGNGLLAFLQHPEQLQLLRENPALVETAVEEMLRYDSAVQLIHRIAKEDLDFKGNLIKAGQDIYLWLGAANRDPDVFANPEQFDITRQHNPHIGFGYGIHLCLGAPLARLEVQIALRTILQRLPEFHLAPEGYQRGSNPGVRGLKSLPLILS